ncbi:hypothetical protein PVAP13_6KG215706 [Panicum virgatum]|uniref:Exocyst complex component Sec8 n=1 Tax=Panicum virgatum TaxID=38727 RepID=A0A8T0RB85_PANVG|nr:hypothetical protein PVAP13_6KG215706 [Panicum virgatum]
MSRGRRGIFDGLPIPVDKSYLKEGLSRIDEGWAAARFDSLPHVVHILTSKDREGEIQFLKEQSDLIEDVVDEVVHAYHHGFNKAIQNYSQILRLFSESADSITGLKGEMAEAKKLLGRKNNHLGQLWYRSLTLRHVLSLLDQVEDVAKVPARIENLMAEKQLYAAVQLHVQSMVMLEREGLQAVGALQDVRSDLTKLRGVLFYKILEELHGHLYNNGEYSSVTLSMVDNEEVPASTAAGRVVNSMQPLSRRTRSIKGDNHIDGLVTADGFPKTSSVDGGSSFDGPDDDSSLDMRESDGRTRKDSKSISREIPIFLSCAAPDEFIDSMIKADAPLNVKYLRTLVQCLSMLGKIAAAGAVICQRVRPTIHDVITSKIKAYTEEASKSSTDKAAKRNSDGSHSDGPIPRFQMLKQKTKNGASVMAAQLVVSPISPAMAPAGDAQRAAGQLLRSIFECLLDILENHIIVGDLLEEKSTSEVDNINTPHITYGDPSWNPDSESSQATGGFSVAFSLSVVQSECQQLLCEILRATPEAATADAAIQTARLANKDPVKEKRDGSEGLSFAFRITDAATSVPNEGQGWRRNSNVPQEGYGTASVIPDQGIFLAASVYRPVFEFMNKIGSMLPQKYSQLGSDGLLAFVNNFLKEHFLPAIFVDYRKCVQQAISSPAAFRPRVNATLVYGSSVEHGRPVLQGLLAVDIIAKEENLIHDDQKLILLASLSDSLEYLADSVERLGESFVCPTTSMSRNHSQHSQHSRSSNAIPKGLASLANEYRRLAIDCVRVLRLEMQLEAIYHMQEMTKREYIEDQDAEDPDDFIISLTTQIARRDEEMAPYITESKRNYVFGGISSVAANASIKALAQMKSINLLGVQQICRNSVALEQALAAIPSIDSEAVQQRLDRVRTFYELLNLPFESLLGFIAEHEYLFSAKEYFSVLKVNVPGREIPMDAERRISQILGH